MARPISLIFAWLLLACFLAGCGPQTAETGGAESSPAQTAPEAEPVEPAEAETDPASPVPPEPETMEPETTEPETTEPAPADLTPPEQPPKLIVIDAGHQAHANTAPEAVGPGSSETKMKVSGGTQGVATGVPEYQLTLTVSQRLRDELFSRGYQVVMVRESNDVDMSNRERADIANRANADVFLRIHANGSEDRAAAGAMTLCPTQGSPYPIGQLYPQCRLLADCVLDELVAATGANRERVWETDTMSGINWCQVPVTLVEMGYMSNPEEDVKLNDPAYQLQIVQGIANGVDRYFSQAEG